MDIVEKLETSKANIRQISILASIPEGRIYKWVQRKSTPTGSDLSAVENIVQLISNLSKEQIKKAVHQVNSENKNLQQALRIATGNPSLKVEDLGNPNTSTGKTIPMPGKTDDKKKDNTLNDSDLQVFGIDFDADNSDQKHAPVDMMNRILSIIEQANRNMEKIADANRTLAGVVDRMSKEKDLKKDPVES